MSWDELQMSDEVERQIGSSRLACFAAVVAVLVFQVVYGLGLFLLGWWLASG